MGSVWQTIIPDTLLLEIFGYLELKDLGRVACVCSRWACVGTDEFLWQELAKRIWKINGPLPWDRPSWREEVKRLFYHTPMLETHCIKKHKDEVLDVAISNNGKYFCTVSKDSYVILWGFDDPSNCIAEVDTSKQLDWELTQYSVFNSDDSLVLVCGVRNEEPALDQSAGCGAIYTVPDLYLVGLFNIVPFTLCGVWLTNRIFIAGLADPTQDIIHIRAYHCDNDMIANSCKGVPGKPCELQQLYRVHQTALFSYEGDRLHQMNLTTAKVPQHQPGNAPYCRKSRSMQSVKETEMYRTDTDLPHRTLLPYGKASLGENYCENTISDDRPLFKANIGLPEEDVMAIPMSTEPSDLPNTMLQDSEMPCDKYASETLQVKTYVMVVAGIHDTIEVFEVTDAKIDLLKQQFQMKTFSTESTTSVPDYLFHIKDNYITGLCLSPDERYAYFNHRSVKYSDTGEDEEDVFERTFSPELKIGIIDLVAMQLVKDIEYKGHVGFSDYSPWYICLDVSQDYILSGSEDGRGYLWEKTYNICLGTLNHTEGVVNGVALSPVDQEICLTVCDDMLIKVWESRHKRMRKTEREQRCNLQLFENSI